MSDDLFLCVVYLAGLVQGGVIACLWLAPDTPLWRGFRDVWSLRWRK